MDMRCGMQPFYTRPCVDAELEDDSLQQLAYTLFCAYCGLHTSPSIKAYIQEQLQVPATQLPPCKHSNFERPSMAWPSDMPQPVSLAQRVHVVSGQRLLFNLFTSGLFQILLSSWRRL